MSKPKAIRVRPLGSRLVVREDALTEETSPGGIILPTARVQGDHRAGTVIATGKRKLDNGETVPLGVDVGERIYYGRFAGSDVIVQGQELKVMHEDDVLGVLVD